MLKESKAKYVLSRELSVLSLKYGIGGLIDEILFSPDEFVIIDDKPGTKTYLSMIHQVYGYCLAFKGMVNKEDSRPIVAALRERGTDNIYWKATFDEKAEKEIVNVINHIHGLISGEEQFNSSTNPNKCKPCRFKNDCDPLNGVAHRHNYQHELKPSHLIPRSQPEVLIFHQHPSQGCQDRLNALYLRRSRID
jgi:CRISPR-associated exonuclease Cas4